MSTVYNEQDTMYLVSKAFNSIKDNYKIDFDTLFNKTKELENENFHFNTEVLNRCVIIFLEKIKNLGCID